MSLSTLNDQTFNLTLKTKAGAPASNVSIAGMTPAVQAAAIALINNFQTDLDAALTAALGLGATTEQLHPISDVLNAITVNVDALTALVAANG